MKSDFESKIKLVIWHGVFCSMGGFFAAQLVGPLLTMGKEGLSAGAGLALAVVCALFIGATFFARKKMAQIKSALKSDSRD